MKNASITIRERQRKSQDSILVYNPTNEDFKQSFDRVVFIIPNKSNDMYGYGPGFNVVPRYVAELYAKHMTDKILGEQLIEKIREENERRVQSGMKEMDKYMGGEEDNFSRQYSVNNEASREEVFSILWKGVKTPYGANDLAQEREEEKPRDNRSLEEKLAEKYDFSAETPQESRTEEPVTASEAAESDENLEDKKNEAIADVIQ